MNTKTVAILFLLFAIFAVSGCASDGGSDDRGETAADDDDAALDDDADDDTSGDDDPDDDDADDDAPPPDLAVPCVDAEDDVYVTPGGLPPFGDDERGAVVRCAPDETVDAATVAERLADIEGITVTSGYRSYRVAYRTLRRDGIAGVGTARLLLPDSPAPGPLPIVAVAHGTVGLADFCAPSKTPRPSDDLIVPWVAAGLPVIAPDYAGMGNEGTQGYGSMPDTVRSVIDAARAAIRAKTPGALDGRMIVAGHSQGGGAALGTQARMAIDGEPDLSLVAAISFAGDYPDGNSANAFRLPNWPIDTGAGVTRVVVALALYAAFANLFGIDHIADAYQPDIADAVIESIETQCVFGITATLATPTADYTPPDTVGEMVEPAFREEVVDCLNDAAECTARAAAYTQWTTENDVPMDADGAPVLMLSGLDDVQRLPTEQACLYDDMVEAGIDVQSCAFAGVDHMGLPAAGIGFAIDWATTGGGECPTDDALPACP
ncbi:MAG: hypothetical protein KJ042_15080 [Deltaproteobacteria bacterium]|nr:hypothetical protein [Deltaproteobacteria bacterium]